MSQNKPVFHFIVPGLLEAVSATSKLSPRGSFPAVEKLLARSRKSGLELDYPHLLAELFQMSLEQGADVPVAALSATTQVGHEEMTDAFWVKASPVLLKPDRDRLVLHQAGIDPDKQASLVSLMNTLKEHFSPLFSEMLPTSDSGWLIRCSSDYSISTTPLMDATGRNIDNLLPGGDDYKKWHQVLNEMQMLLHSHDSLEMGFNALWLEGAGRLPKSAHKLTTMAVLGDDTVLTDFVKWSGARKIKSLQDSGITDFDFSSIISTEFAVMQAIQARSEEKWLTAVQKIDNQLSEAMKMQTRGVLGCIKLYPVNGLVYEHDKKDLLKFWKRPLSLARSGY